MKLGIELEDEITLTMTMTNREALALIKVTGRISGLPSGPRGVFSTLRRALESAVYEDTSVCQAANTENYGAVCFPDTWEEFLADFEKGGQTC